MENKENKIILEWETKIEEVKDESRLTAMYCFMNECIMRIKNNTVDTVTILSAYILHEKFGFGRTRLDRFIHEFNFQAECLMDDYFTWDDQIEVLRQECGINLEIRKNDKDVRI